MRNLEERYLPFVYVALNRDVNTFHAIIWSNNPVIRAKQREYFAEMGEPIDHFDNIEESPTNEQAM